VQPRRDHLAEKVALCSAAMWGKKDTGRGVLPTAE
jgi:hypothetical protein